MPLRRRPKRSRLSLLVILLVGAAVCSEVALRVCPLEWFGLEALDKDWSNHRYEPHPYLAYIPRPNWSLENGGKSYHHNSLGFRGKEFEHDKAKGTYRVVCMGGSSTYGHGPSSDETTWPAQLEKLLGTMYPTVRFEVINAGVSGYNSYESLINLNIRLLDLDPDLALVYHSINDVRLWEWPGYKPDNSHARAVWPVNEPDPLVETLEKSELFRALQFLMRGESREELGHWVVKDYGKKQQMQQTFQQIGPVYFKRNLEQIAALCRFRRVDVMFGQQAFFDDDLEFLSDKKGMRMAEEVITRTAAEQNVPICDIRANMPQDRSLFTNDVHVTDKGALRIATLWAKCIKENGFVEHRMGL
ncbi:MAG: hypothetical protein H6825_14595 [Planctomycetes bacterium]|nr:hypothetical protein [Planctomycetota bacterium]